MSVQEVENLLVEQFMTLSMSNNAPPLETNSAKKFGNRSVTATVMAPAPSGNLFQGALEVSIATREALSPSFLVRKRIEDTGSATGVGLVSEEAIAMEAAEVTVVDTPSPIEDHQGIAVEWWNKKNAALCLNKPASPYPSKLLDKTVPEVANLFVVRSPNPSLLSNVDKFPSRVVAMCHNSNAPMFQGNNVGVSLGNNATMYLDKSAGQFPNKTVEMFQDRNVTK